MHSSGLDVNTKFLKFFVGGKRENVFDPVENKPLPPAFVAGRRHVNMEQMGVQRNFDEGITVHPWLLG
jgi:hypothetical protein